MAAEWVTETEPEWDDDSRHMIEALADLEADTCGGCGGRLSETMHADAKHENWVAAFQVCHRCVAVERAQVNHAKKVDEKVEKDGGHVYNNARHWMAMTREQARKRQQQQNKSDK